MKPYKPRSAPKWVGKKQPLMSILKMGSEVTEGMLKPQRPNYKGYQ